MIENLKAIALALWVGAVFVVLCIAIAKQGEEPAAVVSTPTTASSTKLIPVAKIDRFYTELAKLDKWYTTTRHMPEDVAVYRDKLNKLIKDTEQ